MKLVADDVQSVVIPGTGHWVAEEAPERDAGGADRVPGPVPRRSGRATASPARGEAPSDADRDRPRALSALDGAPVWLNSEPLTAAGLRGRVVARRLLDVLVRQLAAHAAVRQRVARAVSRPRARRRRRARARVRLRARPRQRAPRGRRAGRRLPGRHRQRLRDLAVVREPLLAGRLPRRSRRARPVPPLRRGRLRGDRAGDPAAAGRRRGARPRRRRRPRRGRRLGRR